MKKTNKNLIIRAVTAPQSTGFILPVISDLQELGYDIISISSPGPQLERLREKGVKTYEIPMERHISLFKDICSLWRIIKVLKKEKPIMVHSMTPKAGLLCMLAAWLTRVPKRVHTFTGLVWPTSTGIKRKVLILTDKITCACATHIIPEGNGVRDDLQRCVTKKQMRVLGYGNVRGVDMQRFSYRPEVILGAEKLKDTSTFTFIFVGRIVKDKGINELINAFERIHIKYPETRLFLIGKYEENLDPISEAAHQLITKNNAIIALGPKYGDELISYYAASDCFILPSYREGFPNTVLEAGAMGLPCVVTDINGSREVIEDGKNGLVVPPKDVEALYDAMERMLIDKDTTAKMAANSRQVINSRYEQGYVRKCLYEFYYEILGSK